MRAPTAITEGKTTGRGKRSVLVSWCLLRGEVSADVGRDVPGVRVTRTVCSHLTGSADEEEQCDDRQEYGDSVIANRESKGSLFHGLRQRDTPDVEIYPFRFILPLYVIAESKRGA